MVEVKDRGADHGLYATCAGFRDLMGKQFVAWRLIREPSAILVFAVASLEEEEGEGEEDQPTSSGVSGTCTGAEGASTDDGAADASGAGGEGWQRPARTSTGSADGVKGMAGVWPSGAGPSGERPPMHTMQVSKQAWLIGSKPQPQNPKPLPQKQNTLSH